MCTSLVRLAVFGALLLAAVSSPALADDGYSLRFHGNGTGGIDRVKIAVDDPGTTAPGPPADVGGLDFTLEFWMKASAAENPAPPVACGDNADWIHGHVVIDRDRFNQDRKFGLSIAGGRVVFGVSGEGTGDRTLCGTSVVLDEHWHHVAVQRRRSDGWLGLFVDGVLEAQGDGPDGDVSYPDNGVPGDHCGGPCLDSDPYLVIGAEKHDAGPAFPSYHGWIDELRLSKVLRYSTNFTPPLQPFVADASTVALYHFDEGAGDSIADSSAAVGGPSPGDRHYGGSPAGPEWSTDTPFAQPRFLLKVLRAGTGNGAVTSSVPGVDCGDDCVALFPARTLVTLTPVPAADSVFEGWSGDPDCADGTVRMRADRTCTATFGAGADLIVPVLTVPATAGAGEGTAVTTTVENQGAGVAGASTVRFYLSLDGSLGPGDAELGHGSVPALVGGGGTHTMTTLVAIPAATLAGTYYVFAKADADKAVIETNETNNKKRRPIKIGPDLIIVALSAPATAHAGDTVSIAEATRNKGGGGAGGSSTHLYLSSDPLLDAGDVLLATTAVLPLGPGARSAATISVVLPAGLTAGPYYVIAVADAGGSVPESDENNNTRSQAITLE